MPLTFFAHQAPVLPIARRWPNAVDGVALVVGSMAPDFAYVLNGSRLEIWAHGGPAMVAFGVPVTLLVAWIVVRVIAPVVPDHLPEVRPWHLRDYRGLAAHRFSWVSSPLSALAGVLSHVGLDHLTHEWGWFARHVGWYDDVLVDDLFGRTVTVYRLLQYAGHVGGSAVCIWLLARYGRRRWMRSRASLVAAPAVTALSRTGLVGVTGLGLGGGLAWVLADRAGSATDVLRVAAGTFAGLTLASLFVRSLLSGQSAD